jgi:hypothetical protein
MALSEGAEKQRKKHLSTLLSNSHPPQGEGGWRFFFEFKIQEQTRYWFIASGDQMGPT